MGTQHRGGRGVQIARHRTRSVLLIVATLVVASLGLAIPSAGPAAATATTDAAAAVGPVVAATPMPGPIGSVERSSWTIDEPDALEVAGDGSVWIQNAGGGFGRLTPDGDYRNPGPWGGAFTRGPDGAIWSTSGSTVHRLEADGSSTSFPGGDYDDITDITTGPDGNLWFTTDGYWDIIPVSIVRLTPTGVITNFADASLQIPTDISPGGDGNVWFIDNNDVGRITPAGTVTHFPLPAGTLSWHDLTLGPDGNVWLAGRTFPADQPLLARVTPAGTVTTFTDVGVNDVVSLVAGSDGNLWFRNGSNQQLGRVTPAGTITLIAANGIGAGGSIAAGDGHLWFTDRPGDRVGRVSFGGTVTDWPVTPVRAVNDITAGPDGNLWVTSTNPGRIGRITDDFEVTAFTPFGMPSPDSIAAGSDGNLWFTDRDHEAVGRMTPSGVPTTYSLGGFSRPTAIARGSDGNMWFVDDGRGSIGRVSPAGQFADFPASRVPSATPNDLAAAPDGSLWFTSYVDDRVGRITTDGTITWMSAPEIDGPRHLAVAPDGSVWVATAPPLNISNPVFPSLVRIAVDGTVATIVGPSLSLSIADLEIGPDGAIWFPAGGYERYAPDGTRLAPIPGPVGSPMAVGPEGAMWWATGASAGRLKAIEDGVATFPGAVAGKERATVSWEAPLTPVQEPITGYTVVASPGGATCSTTGARSCTVTGLSAGVAYSFSVRALSAGGPGPAITTPGSTVPWSGGWYHPISPLRLLDSRPPGLGFSGRLTSTQPRSLTVAGPGATGQIPATASAVVLNVTVTDSTAESFLTVYPTGTPKPNASNLNFAAGQIIPNLVTVAVGTGGRVDLATAVGSTHVVADVVGYYDDVDPVGNGFNPTTPQRLLDTRQPYQTVLTAAAPQDLLVATSAGGGRAPETATAVVVNVTATGSDAQSFITAWPTGESKPNASNLNVLPGQTIPNLAIVKVGEEGKIRFATALGSVHLIVDLVGYFDPGAGSRFHPMAPRRVLDTRFGPGPTGMVGPGETRPLAVAGAPGTNVPVTATGLVANLTTTGATAESFASIFPGDVARPDPFSNLNFGRSQIIPNLTTVGVAPDGTVALYNHLGQTHLVLDAVGWYETS